MEAVNAGLSAGAGTRLLVDYPPEQRGYVLDYLFKPSFGASLQVLKLEIGGTGDSTTGTEDSHERTRGDINMTFGYELWFAEEALARNEEIVLYGLAWTFPQWVDSAPEGFCKAAVTYLVDCASASLTLLCSSLPSALMGAAFVRGGWRRGDAVAPHFLLGLPQ